MINQIVLGGRLTKDPELRTTSNGTAVATFTIAVNRDHGDNQADFIECVAWRQTGEFISKWFRKGQMMILSGSLQGRKWQEQETGKNRISWEVNVQRCWFCEKKADGQAQMDGRPQQEYRTAKPAPDIYADENPFGDDEGLPF